MTELGQLYHVAAPPLNDRADPIRSLTPAERSGAISLEPVDTRHPILGVGFAEATLKD